MTATQCSTSAGPSLDGWYTAEEAARRLRRSTRSLYRLVKEGVLQKPDSRPRAGIKGEMLYDPADVDRLVAERFPPRVMKALATNKAGKLTEGARQLVEVLGAMGRAITELAERQAQPKGPYLTIEQAKAYCGLTETRIRRAVAAGELRGVKDRGWKVLRADIDIFAERLAASESSKLIAGGAA